MDYRDTDGSPAKTDGYTNKSSHSENKVIVVFLVIAALLIATGHFPRF